MTPASAAGGSGLTLTIGGTGFVPSSVAAWNGSARPTTYVSGTQLTATIPAGDLTTSGTGLITVQNPSTGSSNPISFPIANPKLQVSLAPQIYPASTGPVFVASADFNGDGKLDLAIANSVANTVSIYLGAGDGTFTHVGDYATGLGPTGIATGDFNRDGKIDLAVSAGIGVSLLLGNGTGAFPSRVDYQAGTNPSAVTVGDFNADGYLDMVVANQGSNTVSVLLGYGDATFQGHVDYATGNQPMSVTAGDFNGDGIPDLAVANFADNTVSILLGNGDGTFQPQTTFATGAGPAAVVAADFNHDGKLDLAIANSGYNTVSLLLGNGNGTFQPQTEFVAGAAPGGLAVGDFNSDGNLDLAVVNSGDNTLVLLLGNGSGSFAKTNAYPAGAHPASLAVGDFSADGGLDLAVASRDDGAVTVMVQEGPLLLAPDSGLSFNSQPVGIPSVAKSVTLTNSGNLALTINSVSSAGGDSGDFGASHNCPLSPSTLAPVTSCTINVTFTPTAAGPRKSLLTISGNTFSSQAGVILTGVGSAASLSPTSLGFSSQTVGIPSTPQMVTLTNVGSGPMNIWQMAFLGTNAADYSMTSTCGSTLGAGNNCSISVTFTPATTGTRTASLLVSDDGGGSPQDVALTGTGVAGPSNGLSAVSLSFPEQKVGTSSSPQSVVFTNTGQTTMTIRNTEISGSGRGDFALMNSCGPRLGIGKSCTLQITFVPHAEGTRNALVMIVTDAARGIRQLRLEGVGVQP